MKAFYYYKVLVFLWEIFITDAFINNNITLINNFLPDRRCWNTSRVLRDNAYR